MNMEEIKKDVKHIQVSKNTIIIALSIALVLVSAVAIGLAVGHEEHGDRGERDGGQMEQNSKEQGMYDDHNINPNDGETNDNQTAPVNPNTKPAATPVVTPVAPQVTPKQ